MKIKSSIFKFLRRLTFAVLRYSCVPALIRETLQKNKVTIVLYHGISAELFERHVQYYKKAYNLISLEQYLQSRKIKSVLPPKSLVITFDDGYKRNYPLLNVVNKYDVPITIFLCSEVVNTQRSFWFDAPFPPGDMEKLSKMSNTAKLSYLRQFGFDETKELAERSVLNKKEVLEMSSRINFQAHTRFHPFLPNCDDAMAKKEIFECKSKLENDFGFRINVFAYPNGDYCERDLQLVKEAGYEAALTTMPFYNTEDTDLHQLKRLNIPDAADVNEAAVKASGLWTFLRLACGIQRGGKYVPAPQKYA